MVLRGSTDSILDDLERAVDDGVNTYKVIFTVLFFVSTFSSKFLQNFPCINLIEFCSSHLLKLPFLFVFESKFQGKYHYRILNAQVFLVRQCAGTVELYLELQLLKLSWQED